MAKTLRFQPTSTAGSTFIASAGWIADAARVVLATTAALAFGTLCMVRVTSVVFESEVASRLPPTETAAFEARLASARPEFERLAAMAAEDEGARRIAFDHLWPSPWPRHEPMPLARWQNYRELFRTLEVVHGLRKSERIEGLTYFIVSRKGALSDSYERGYAYCRPHAHARCADIALREDEIEPGQPKLEPLSVEGWYAYELRWDG